jgi:hypothetical protein
VEASFFLDFLDTFSSRKKFQYLIAPMESFGPKAKSQILLWFPVVGVNCKRIAGLNQKL